MTEDLQSLPAQTPFYPIVRFWDSVLLHPSTLGPYVRSLDVWNDLSHSTQDTLSFSIYFTNLLPALPNLLRLRFRVSRVTSPSLELCGAHDQSRVSTSLRTMFWTSWVEVTPSFTKYSRVAWEVLQVQCIFQSRPRYKHTFQHYGPDTRNGDYPEFFCVEAPRSLEEPYATFAPASRARRYHSGCSSLVAERSESLWTQFGQFGSSGSAEIMGTGFTLGCEQRFATRSCASIPARFDRTLLDCGSESTHCRAGTAAAELIQSAVATSRLN